MSRNASVISTQIPANEAISGVVDLGDHELFAIETPDDFTGTTLTFQSKPTIVDDNQAGEQIQDWDDVHTDNGTELSITVAGGRVTTLVGDKRDAVAALRYIRVRSGTSATPVAVNPSANIRFIVK